MIAALTRQLNIKHVEESVHQLIGKRQFGTRGCTLVRLPTIQRLFAASLIFTIWHRSRHRMSNQEIAIGLT